ncbi:alpha/beta fold hydrolase [Aromatoleum petrolei]|uniref:Alpha/beta fold hydrolase n=1 Tax=Aromatoleum petrolei TaxID=76116 RepID=A0ABX1MSG2_9RHOO|nr:alpha/beta hydrolase [Aromatoleum petrolei]NMF89039.1 alpha/beta fold hydrolase [Aromatoleum petrolei]QTQ34399.1 Hydrolase [Aromatoleum petrolei]
MRTHEERLAALGTHFPLVEAGEGGRRWTYRTAGRGGRTLVLLHGIGSSSASWLDVALAAGRDFRVVAWDAPGYGGSTPLAAERPLATDYAQSLEGFLATLGIEGCVLVGHSLGALMATAYAAAYPRGRAAQLILVSPARGYGAREFDAERERVRASRLQALAALGVAGMAAERAGRLVSPSAGASVREWVRWNMASLNADGYRQATELLCGDDLARYAPAPLPVACFCGADDVVTPPAACEAVAAAYGVPLVLLPGCGHASPVEIPHLLAATLRESIEMKGECCE